MLDHASVFGGGITAGSLPCRFISLLELEWSDLGNYSELLVRLE